MSLKHESQKGFTAVELLITLIIASMFLFAGYQLYTQVTRDGNDANTLAKVSNVAYEELRKRAASTTSAYPNGCTIVDVSETVYVMDNVTYSVTTQCPQSVASSTDLFLVKVRAYNPNPTGGSGYGPLIMESATYVN